MKNLKAVKKKFLRSFSKNNFFYFFTLKKNPSNKFFSQQIKQKIFNQFFPVSKLTWGKFFILLQSEETNLLLQLISFQKKVEKYFPKNFHKKIILVAFLFRTSNQVVKWCHQKMNDWSLHWPFKIFKRSAGLFFRLSWHLRFKKNLQKNFSTKIQKIFRLNLMHEISSISRRPDQKCKRFSNDFDCRCQENIFRNFFLAELQNQKNSRILNEFVLWIYSSTIKGFGRLGPKLVTNEQICPRTLNLAFAKTVKFFLFRKI